MSQKPNPPELEEELVPEDDTVIGHALRWSLLALIGIAALVAAVLYLRREEELPEAVIEKQVGEIADLVIDEAVLPAIRFTDVTRESGIDFVHFNGATGEKLLPETMGGGVAFLDAEGDGDQDAFFVNGAPWPHAGGAAPGNRLYANDGSGRFADATRRSGLAGDSYGMGAAVADCDGDADPDVFTTGIGASHLYRNDGDLAFADVTASAGVRGEPDQWTTSSGFFDYDGDGDLDLFVCQYVRWSREIDQQLAFTLNGVDRAYGPPTNYAGRFSTLFRNEGDGRFADVSEQAGLHVANPATGDPMGKALGCVFVDVDGDGRQDVLVANDTVQNHLFRNRGDGTFEEIGFRSGIGFDGNGKATGAMGVDVADYREDGGLAVCIGNFANEMSSFFVAGPGQMAFTDDAIGEGIGSPSRQKLSFGMFFFDYDLDGRLDLLQVNGHLEETINEVQPSQFYLQAPQLFWNAGPAARACFTVVPEDSAGDLGHELAGRGSAFADIDADGDLDVLIAQVGARPVLLRNDQALGHHWLRVRLVGSGGNLDAIGAWVAVRTGDRSMRRLVAPTKSYLSQSELPVTFGLAGATSVDAIRVTWPDGTEQDVAVPDGVDRELVVRRDV